MNELLSRDWRWSDLQLTPEQEERAKHLVFDSGHDPYVAIVFARVIVLMQDRIADLRSGAE